MADLSIIIVSFNVRQLLADCLISILEACPDPVPEVIVVDNASSDGSARMVRERFPQVVLIANTENVGFARANNQGYAVSHGEYVLLLNPDTVVKPGAVQTVLGFMETAPDAGVASCRLLNPDGSLQRSIRSLPTVREHLLKAVFLDRIVLPENRKETYYRGEPFIIGYPMGAFMMVRRAALGGGTLLDDRYFMYSEEKDLALRLKQRGYGCWFVPGAGIVHVGGQSTGQAPVAMFLELQKSQIIYFRGNYRGIYRDLLVWSYWLYLVTSTLGAGLLAHTEHGRHRLRLFAAALWQYPREAWRSLYRPRWSAFLGRLGSTAQMVYTSFASGTVRLSIDNTERSRQYYSFFTSRHPRYPLIRNKTVGVALLRLPESFDEYISGRRREYLRRMRNRAQREGYRFDRVDPNGHIDEILDINRSLPVRQGRPMDAGYLERQKLEEYFADKAQVFAVLSRQGRLRAYAYVPVLGDVCLFDRLLGHADDLEKGIMYFLLSDIVRAMIEKRNAAGSPNWVEYDTFLGGSDGIRFFKEKMGFSPRNVRWVMEDASARS
ncbi:MAG: glycosyltransferase family 2 protein [Candidatus Edwardsbacteria bacterium]|nr:glycosyltransferase family 2 protein [Candidatus Edwardsbacteria bacterium]